MNNELKRYCKELDYTPILNIMIDGTRNGFDPYVELSQYIIKTFGDKLPKSLNVLKNKKIKNSDRLEFLSICFISEMSGDSLKKMFGDPIFHNEFGEGFEGTCDEETGQYIESEIKFDYASYFVTINDVMLHIGYDHRGTRIEVPKRTSLISLMNILKKIVDLYKEKV